MEQEDLAGVNGSVEQAPGPLSLGEAWNAISIPFNWNLIARRVLVFDGGALAPHSPPLILRYSRCGVVKLRINLVAGKSATSLRQFARMYASHFTIQLQAANDSQGD